MVQRSGLIVALVAMIGTGWTMTVQAQNEMRYYLSGDAA